MSIRTLLLRCTVPLALLACSSSTGSQAPDEESDAAVLRGPPASTRAEAPDEHVADGITPTPIHFCGLAGERACAGSSPCVSGTLDVNGTCVACGNIETPFFPSLGMDSSGFVEAVVQWGSNPEVPVALFLIDPSDGQTIGSYYSYTPGGGTWTFPGLFASKTYQISVSAFEPGEDLCPAYASANVTTPPSSVSLDLGANDGPDPLGPDYSKGTLTIHQDGTWSVSGAYIQLGMNSGPFLTQWAQLTCSADPGVSWPVWSMAIAGNAFGAGTGYLTGSGQNSWLTRDWLKIVYETSANCHISVTANQP